MEDGSLTCILSAPYGAEVSSVHLYPNINGCAGRRGCDCGHCVQACVWLQSVRRVQEGAGAQIKEQSLRGMHAATLHQSTLPVL